MGLDISKSLFAIYTIESKTKFPGREYLQYSLIEEVYLVLDEDGTEIDEEEYFQVKISGSL